MKTSPKENLARNEAEKGVVQVAVWKDSAEISKLNDVFTNYSQDAFFDFSRPLRLLDSPGWNASIRASSSDEGFFVFTSDEKPF